MGQREQHQRAARSSRSRWRSRTALRAALGLLLVLAAAVVALTRSPLLGALLRPQLSRILSCDVDFRSAVIDPDGRIIIRGLSLSAPDVRGPAARFLTAERVRIEVDWRDALAGAPRATSLTVDKGWLRVSQDAESNTLNVETIAVGSGGEPSLSALPALTLRRSVFEFGQHDDRAFASFFSVPVGGSASSSPDEPLVYEFTFQQIPESPTERPDPTPATIRGRIDAANSAGRITLSNIDLAEWGASTDPNAQLRGVLNEWAALDIRGEIPEASLELSPEAGIVAELKLDRVSMTLPVPANTDELDAPTGQTPELMTMRDVRGSFRYDSSGALASVEGLIEDLPYAVTLSMEDLDLGAPFTMQARTLRPFSVGSSPRLLPFAPGIVRRRFATFSGPTALVDGQVIVQRPRIDELTVGDISYQGTLTFTNGRAAYEHFSYPVENLSGHIEFDDDEIRIVQISGVGPTGASLFADGRIAPPRENAEADIRITIIDVPVDELFEQSLPESRREIVSALFDRESYHRLLDAGLIVAPEAHAEAQEAINAARVEIISADPEREAQLRASIDDAQRVLDTPAFALAGEADLNISIHRDLGPDAEWSRRIDVTFDRAGILVSRFPYPALAQAVNVAIRDHVALVTVGRIDGLTGAEGSLAADIVLERAGSPVFEPDIDIAADRVPIDPLLLAALPARQSPDAPAPRDLLTRLGLSGAVSTHAHVVRRPGGALGFNTEVNFNNMSASFSEDPAAPAVAHDIQGSLEVNERSLRVAQLDGIIDGAPFSVSAETRFPDGDEPLSYTVIAATEGFDLTSPVELAIDAFDPSAVSAIASLRERWRPTGRVDVDISIAGARGRSPLDITASLSSADHVEVNAFDGRLAIDSSAGALRYTPREIAFEGLHADIAYDGEPFAAARLDGRYALAGEDARQLRLAMELDDARIESPLLDHALRTARADAALRWRDRLSLEGRFDAALAVTSQPDAPAVAQGRVEPRSLALTRRDQRLSFDDVSGAILFGPTGGSIEDVHARGASLDLRASGEYTTADRGFVRLDLEAQAPSLNPAVRALLPQNVDELLDRLTISSQGPLSLTDASLLVESGDSGEPSLAFEGMVGFSEASADVAVPLEEALGRVRLAVHRAGAQDADLDLDFHFDAVTAAGLRVTDARARVVSGERPGVIAIPSIEADAHSGRIFGSALLTPTAPEGPLEFDASFEAAGVRFAPALRDLVEEAEHEGQPAPPVDDPLSRGLLDAQLSVTGVVGLPDTRVGRGFARVQGGEVLSLPLLLPLIELSNLKPPLGEKLDFAQARFYLLGDRIDFEQLGVSSPSIAILGEGSMEWPSTRLDLRLNSRSESNRIPLLSDLLEGLRDELATIVVTGRLAEPEFSVEQLSGARRFLGSIVPPDEEGPSVARPSDDDQEHE